MSSDINQIADLLRNLRSDRLALTKLLFNTLLLTEYYYKHKMNGTFMKIVKKILCVTLSLFLIVFNSPAQNGALTLKEGTEVQLKFSEEISSKTATEGDDVFLELSEDIKIGDAVVAKAGAKAFGSVSHSKKAGMMGKAGELNIRLEHIKVGDSRIKLRGSKGKEGEGKVGTAVVLTVLFGPIGLIKKGKNIEIKQGTALKAYVEQDIALPAIK